MESTSGKDSILIQRDLGRGEMVADMEKEAKRVERDTSVINNKNNNNNNNNNNNWKKFFSGNC